MHCCSQISIVENHIVFDAKLMWLNKKNTQKKHIVTVYFHAFSSKANYDSPLKTYIIDNIEDICKCQLA